MSTLKADTIVAADGSSPVTLTGQTAAKAWVNFNSIGTVAVRQSGGVSSISDNGTGDYTVNFATALTDANYAIALGSQPDNNNLGYDRFDTFLTTSFHFQHRENQTLYDTPILAAIVVR